MKTTTFLSLCVLTAALTAGQCHASEATGESRATRFPTPVQKAADHHVELVQAMITALTKKKTINLYCYAQAAAFLALQNYQFEQLATKLGELRAMINKDTHAVLDQVTAELIANNRAV